MITRIVVGAGTKRHVFALASDKDARRQAASDVRRFLFPSNGAFQKARRRGERALAQA